MLLATSLALFAALATPQDPAPDAQALQQQRLGRLTAIAIELQDEQSDAVALLTEGVRLCGFALWSEDRTVLAEPTGAPRLGLAITDAEIRWYCDLFRSGGSVALADLIDGLDVHYHALGREGSIAPHVRAFLREDAVTANASARALAGFLDALGVQRAGAEGRVSGDAVELDAIQTLLLVRVLTEDLATPLRRALAQRGDDGDKRVRGDLRDGGPIRERRPAIAATRIADGPGWAEDAYVGGITGLFGELIGETTKLRKFVKDGTGRLNALASIAKFIATYAYLTGKVWVEEPGQPLIRTKDTDPGQRRTLVAKFWIDGNKVTDWLKDNRQLAALAGLDLDMPKTGALKGVLTEWDIAQDRRSSKSHLIQTVRGQPDISKIRTDDNGEARIRVEGTPQRQKLDPLEVLPVDKEVRMVVTPQVKATEMQQDLVDAVTGAIGIHGGGVGFLTPVIETLYRMKWKGGRRFTLQVRDWVPCETICQAELTLRGSGSWFRREAFHRMTIDRVLQFKDLRMQSIGFEMPEMLDPEVLKMMPPLYRKQMEEGMKQLAEAAKKRSYLAEGPGTVSLHIHDRESRGGEVMDCGDDPATTHFHSWDADFEGDVTPELLQQMNCNIDIDLNTMNATVRIDGAAMGVQVSTSRDGKGRERRNQIDTPIPMRNFVTFQAPHDTAFVVPVKETEVRDMNARNYYGTLSIPFEFGRGFRGTAIVSFSVTRKLKPKEEGR